jgi:hypothetical protein
MILILNDRLDRLCNDGRWRRTALFGNVRGCVQQYRRLGNAKARARQAGGFVVQLPEGAHIDAAGNCWREVPCPDKPGYVRTERLNLLDYRIPHPDAEAEFDEIGAIAATGFF